MPKLPKQHRIFVVDDEPVIVSTLQLILRDQGLDVTAFTDPIEALQAVHMSAPDLVITDVVMPELSGIELAIVIRETCPDCEVLLFSGRLLTDDIFDTARNRGYEFEVLTKPVPPADMIRRVRIGLGLGTEGTNAGVQSR